MSLCSFLTLTALSQGINFSVQSDSLLQLTWNTPNPYQNSIKFINTGDSTASFKLKVNDAIFYSYNDIAQAIDAMPNEFPGEPLERKVWRFVADNTFNFVPLTNNPWVSDPLIMLNSLGFGYCRNFSTVYASILSHRGYETRTFALTDHAVPEIKINGKWQTYDPTLSVYYYKIDGTIANASELQADGNLLVHPVKKMNSALPTAYESTPIKAFNCMRIIPA